MSNQWIEPRPEYYVQVGAMFENPHGVPPDEVTRMIVENPPHVTAQVVFGKYVDSDGLVFSGELIQMFFDQSMPVVVGDRWFDQESAEQARVQFNESPTRRNDYNQRWYTGVDFGRQTDFTTIFVLDVLSKPARLVYYRRLNRVPWEAIYREVGVARAMFGPNILGDGSGPGGDVVLDALESRMYCAHHRSCFLPAEQPSRECAHRGLPGDGVGACNSAYWLPLSCVEPFVLSSSSKKELVDHLRIVLSHGYDIRAPNVEFGLLRAPPIPQLEEEMTIYAWEDKRLMTDCVFGLALAAWHGLEDPARSIAHGSTMGS